MRLYCLLLSSDSGISIGRLNCYMYVFQKVGFKLDYSFRINVSGVRSKNFSRYLEEQVSTGLLTQKKGIISLTNESIGVLERFILSYDEIVSSDRVIEVLSSLSDDELHLVCVTDIIINDVIESKGVGALVESRDFIENSVSNLCSAYTKENFNLAVALMKNLKKECLLDE